MYIYYIYQHVRQTRPIHVAICVVHGCMGQEIMIPDFLKIQEAHSLADFYIPGGSSQGYNPTYNWDK